jgi:hypothetical protein
VKLLRTHAVHAIRWSRVPPLLAPGRASDAIAEFVVLHVHGARKRAHVAYRYVLEEGLAYQELLANADPQVQRTTAPLTVEAAARCWCNKFTTPGRRPDRRRPTEACM